MTSLDELRRETEGTPPDAGSPGRALVPDTYVLDHDGRP